MREHGAMVKIISDGGGKGMWQEQIKDRTA